MASAIYVYPLQKVISHNMFLKLYCFIFFCLAVQCTQNCVFLNI